MNSILQQKLKLIPKKPGCYLWKNSNNDVIYVGKAKNLFNRVHQYFDKTSNKKTMLLVSEIFDVDYIIVNNSNEALILENNLIKKYWPKYNILLKDSSKYPYIVVTDELEPKLLYTRKYNKVKGKYYGPLADSKFNAYELYKFLQEISPFAKTGPLKNQISVFLQMYMEDNNLAKVDDVNSINLAQHWRKCIDDLFHGNSKKLAQFLSNLEELSSSRLDFEHAQKYKDLIVSLENLDESQIVELVKNKYTDYFCYYHEDEYVVFNVFSYINGNLIAKHNSIHRLYDKLTDIVMAVTIQYYTTNPLPQKIVISLDSSSIDDLCTYFNARFCPPLSSSDIDIMEMGLKNAKDYLHNNLLIEQQSHDNTIGACLSLAKILGVPKIETIEAFDNSNINLKHSTSGMVVFKNGLPLPSMYRHYNLRTNDNASDFQYMQEIIYRRYKNVIQDNLPLPDLIIVDGGIIQINAAKLSLEKLNILHRINLIGLQKDDKHKTDSIVFSDGTIMMLDRSSGLYKMLCNIQNEVHNFAIKHYRQKHIKSMLESWLDNVKGIGTKTRNKILEHYPQINAIMHATKHELLQFLPPKKVEVLLAEIEKYNKNLSENISN